MLLTVLLGSMSNAMTCPVKDFTKICMIVNVRTTQEDGRTLSKLKHEFMCMNLCVVDSRCSGLWALGSALGPMILLR
jgi:hypothetical protein